MNDARKSTESHEEYNDHPSFKNKGEEIPILEQPADELFGRSPLTAPAQKPKVPPKVETEENAPVEKIKEEQDAPATKEKEEVKVHKGLNIDKNGEAVSKKTESDKSEKKP